MVKMNKLLHSVKKVGKSCKITHTLNDIAINNIKVTGLFPYVKPFENV